MCNISTKIGSGCDHEEKAGHVRMQLHGHVRHIFTETENNGLAGTISISIATLSDVDEESGLVYGLFKHAFNWIVKVRNALGM